MSDENKTTDKKEKKTEKVKLTTKAKKFYVDHKAEFLKISWPNRDDLIKKTGTVIFTSLLFGVIVFGLDKVYQIILQFVVNLAS